MVKNMLIAVVLAILAAVLGWLVGWLLQKSPDPFSEAVEGLGRTEAGIPYGQRRIVTLFKKLKKFF